MGGRLVDAGARADSDQLVTAGLARPSLDLRKPPDLAATHHAHRRWEVLLFRELGCALTTDPQQSTDVTQVD
jgi:hypothetical protein